MKAQLRIVAGSLKGRKLTWDLQAELRPIPDMARQALFSILGDGVPDAPFFDLFAGTGAVGLEAVSRGASEVILIERDPGLSADILRNARTFGVIDRVQVLRADVYRWVDRWQPGVVPANVFLGPPFPDFEHRPESLIQALQELQRKMITGSVLAIQSERKFKVEQYPDPAAWDHRLYGRNRLSFWVRTAIDGS